MSYSIQFCVLGFMFLFAAEGATANSYHDAGKALLEGETSYTKSLIQDTGCNESPECIELSIIYQIINDNSAAAIKQLNAYQTQYADAARTHAFAAEAWRSIGHQVNIFRKRTYYNKALQAKFRAGLGTTTLPRYQVLRASAFGQEGDIAAQRALTAEIAATDPKWGFIAEINLAQNTDDFAHGEKVVLQALADYPNDFFINERVAQYYWTLDDLNQAQKHFLKACEAVPEAFWHDRKDWLDACTLVVQFTEQKSINPEAAISALKRVLEEQQLLTLTNLEYAVALLQLIDKLGDEVHRNAAIKFLDRFIKDSDNTALIDRAFEVRNASTARDTL